VPRAAHAPLPCPALAVLPAAGPAAPCVAPAARPGCCPPVIRLRGFGRVTGAARALRLLRPLRLPLALGILSFTGLPVPVSRPGTTGALTVAGGGGMAGR
jgi:hypothetical protein